MKKHLMIVLAMSLVSFAAHAETAHVTVNGMVCAFCAQGLEKSFGKLDSVGKTEADLDNKQVTITIKDGKQLDDATIEKAIKKNGLDTVKIERTNP
jgi:copper chaperone CopZ